MALSSPGIEVKVIDESFYTPAAGATVPLIVVATAESKPNGSGTGTASGTTKANAGKVFLISSQRELTDTFGNPTFYTDASNNPLHGSELNEYGLQAAYSYLGVANRAYVVRADADLGQLTGSSSEPTGEPTDGTYWFDTDDSIYGIFEWNGDTQKFTNKAPNVISAATDLDGVSGATYTGIKSSVGSIGDYAIVTWNTQNKMWYKNEDNIWVQVGSSDESAFDSSSFYGASQPVASTSWDSTTHVSSHPTITATLTPNSIDNANIIINGTDVNVGGTTPADLVQAINHIRIPGVGAKLDSNNRVKIYSDGTSAITTPDSTQAKGGILIEEGTQQVLQDLGITAGFYASPELQISAHSKVPLWKATDRIEIAGTGYSALRPSGSVWVKSTTPNLGASWKVKLYSTTTGLWTTVDAPVYNSAAEAINKIDAGGGVNITTGTLYILANATGNTPTLADFKIYRRTVPSPSSGTGTVASPTFSAGTKTFTIRETRAGTAALTSATASFTGTTAEDLVAAISSVGLTNVEATINADNKIKITHKLGGEVILTDGTGTPLATAGITAAADDIYAATGDDDYVISNWKALTYEAKTTAPTATPADGTLWYSTTLDEVDMLVHNGTTWVGYLNEFSDTDPAGPIVSATQPTAQSDGTALVSNDLWIDSGNSEQYGQKIYKYDGNNLVWVAVDVSDQTSEDGILFADARYGSTGQTGDVAGTIADLLSSNYLDPDAPDPDLYPRGMLLWNTRRSGYNVKKFVKGHIDINADNGLNIRFNGVSGSDTETPDGEIMDGRAVSGVPTTKYKADRWIGWNTTAEDGSGLFGRQAQRKTIVAALKSEVKSNQDLRDEETRTFTLLAAPGYPELTIDLVALNIDRGITGFVVADSPFRLKSSSTDLLEWGLNSNNALADGEKGFTSYDEYMAVFYPSGFTTDLRGNNIVVPPSHMMLRTIAVSDAVSFPWFAPAGTRRGGITNASSVGYINDEGEFTPVSLNEGTRDTMQSAKINPITFITGSGLVNFGQFTRARNASALDRINVARLTAYLRRQLSLLAKPFLFEPNDKITRDEIKQAAESLLLELVGQRALYDFLVVCDETNNTPSRIDRNELYLDIAIEPVKSVEYIYIPLRLKNTGEIATLGAQ